MMTDYDFSDLQTTRLDIQYGQQLIFIDRAECTASVSLKGGQVLSFTPHGQHPVLWQNERLDFKSEDPLRQGIPVCWPWFGDLNRNPESVTKQFLQSDSQPVDMPNHGLVRGVDWELLKIDEQQEHTDVVVMTELPQPILRLIAKYRFGTELTIQLTTENRDPEMVHFSSALHSYFAVSDISSIVIPDLDAIPYLDALPGWQKRVQNGDLKFTGEVDRAYFDTPAMIHIKDPDWRRDILIKSSDSHSAVVWNPWTEKSRRLSQFSPNAYQSMVCVETAKILNDAVSLDTGRTHSFKVEISVQGQ